MESKSINAYFADLRQANAAASRLYALRASDVSVSEQAPSAIVSSATAVEPYGAGHAPASAEALSGSAQAADYRLSAVIQADIHHKALRIVEDNGGWI